MAFHNKYTIEHMQKLAQRRGGKYLSKKYISVLTKSKWQCREGHIWNAIPSNTLRGSWCPECRGSKKATIGEMQAIAKKRGGRCLSNEYKNNKTKLKWQCSEGHVWEAIPVSIKRGTWCPICSVRKGAEANKLSMEQMKAIAKQRGGKCVSKEYINANIRLKWQCSEGHIWKAKPSHIKSGSWCPYCAGKYQTIDDMRRIAHERGGKCLSEEYVSDRTKLMWKCSERHIWEATPGNIKNGHWCPECGGSKNLTIEEMQAIAKERGGKCLSETYINARTKLKWQCKDGHVWEAVPDSIKGGRWCPECSVGLEERICRVFFEQIFKTKFQKCRPKWLINQEKNQMELDGYSKALGLAFEYQGEQHYTHVEYFQSKQQFIKRKRDDIEKKRLCEKHGIVLIQIPQIHRRLKVTQLKDYIIKECRKSGFKNLPQNADSIKIHLQEAYIPDSTTHLEILKNIVKEKGGKCLSKQYVASQVKITFQCKEGHVWKAVPVTIKTGSWCPECAVKNRAEARRATIEEMQIMAKEQGGRCLSKKYINNSTKLTWKCRKGHVWKSTYDTIRSGHWCPYCAGNKKRTIEEMQTIAKERRGKCLSDKYINARTNLKWECSEGHVWEAIPDNVRRGSWCPYCAGKYQTIDDMRRIAHERGGRCLSKKYVDNRTKLKWQCSEGHAWEATPNHIKNGTWCPYCAGKYQTIDDMRRIAHERGGKCLSKDYINAITRLKWQCSEGHVWEATPHAIKRGTWCPNCVMQKRKKWLKV